MLNPNKDRLEYGKLLAPPEGARLDFAVGTTYSLDLDALVGATLALGLSEESDSELTQNPICLLEALRATGDSVALFCEGGQIHLPNNPTRLYILLEKMVYPVVTKKRRGIKDFPSFHPKVWIIKYVDKDEEPLYRFIVMSRNLTFDRNWDVVYSMEGRMKGRAVHKNDPLCDFLTYLQAQLPPTDEGKNKRKGIRNLIKDLPYVKFELSEKEFTDYDFIPNGVKKESGGYWSIKDADLFESTLHEKLIISPFLSADIIRDFNNAMGQHITHYKNTLITRASSLGKLKPKNADTFRIFTLKDTVVDGESVISEEDANLQKQDIHAKLYMTRKYSDSDLYLGSLNASHNAVYGNVEFMLHLKSSNRYLNTDKLLETLFCGSVDGKDNPFIEVNLENVVEEEGVEEGSFLDGVVKEINRSNPKGKVIETEEAFSIRIDIPLNCTILKDYEIRIRPLLSKKQELINKTIEFSKLQTSQLSEFFVISVDDGDNVIERVILIPLENLPEDRESQVVSSIINSKDNFFRYVAFLLGDDALISSLEIDEFNALEGINEHQKRNMIAPAIYEKMLKTAAQNPEKLKGLDYLISMVSKDGVIPDGFIELYSTVKKAAKIEA